MGHNSAAQQFLQQTAQGLDRGTLVRVRLASPRATPAGAEPLRALMARPVRLKQGLRLSITRQYATRDEVKNWPVAEGLAELERQLPQFASAFLATTEGQWQLQATARGQRLIAHAARREAAPSLAHDEAKNTWLDATAQDWLQGLGVTTAEGRVAAQQADKHRQIERYGEILTHLAQAAGWGPPAPPQALTVADMGCGKGYLTFGAWHLFRRRWQWPVRVLGVERRADLAQAANRLARRIQADGLEFLPGDIGATTLPPLDAMIALHACDTATDDALLRGIKAGARLLMVAPCCHQEVRPQLGRPEPLAPVLRHGLMAGRMAEWLTDGLRALFLEWAGYETRMIEFVASEHTPRNLLLAGVRRHQPFGRPAAREHIARLKSFFGLHHHALDALLDAPDEHR